MEINSEINNRAVSKKTFLRIGVFFVILALLSISSYYMYMYWQKTTLEVNKYHIQQIREIEAFESTIKNSSIDNYLAEDTVPILLKYASALVRQNDFGYKGRTESAIKALDIYSRILASKLSNGYKVFAVNEMFTVYIQSGNDIATVANMFTQEEVRRKAEELGLGSDIESIRSDFKKILYSNLLIDKVKKANDLIPTKIALARISMQEYVNQMVFRTFIDLNSPTASSTNEQIKSQFSERVIRNYEQYKNAVTNTILGNYYTAEAGYMMAWSLNRAGIYSGNQDLVNQSYKLFEDTIQFIDSVKSTNYNVWQLSILTKVFYATTVLSANKEAYIDPRVADNRNKALNILTELSSSAFLSDDRYYGARQYLSREKYSDMDWITTLILLSAYDQGLSANLKSLGWKI